MNIKVLLSFLVPTIVVMAIAGFNSYELSKSKTFEFPIEGIDPRDLLSGHYLVYQIKWPIELSCKNNKNFEEGSLKDYVSLSAKLCLEPTVQLGPESMSCETYILGNCLGEKFRTDSEINRFYLPEEHAKSIEKFVIDKQASIQIGVTKKGTAYVKDLLIHGQPWKLVHH